MTESAIEQDMVQTLKQFTIFCDYVKANKPAATPGKKLSTKACSEINLLLAHPEVGAKPTRAMLNYPSVALWFEIARKSRLIELDNRGKSVFKTTQRYETFQEMSPYTQYLSLFATWFFWIDSAILYDQLTLYHIQYESIIDRFMLQAAKIRMPQWMVRKAPSNEQQAVGQDMMNYCYRLVRSLGELGLVTYVPGSDLIDRRVQPVIEQMKLTDLGLKMITACKTRPYSWFNVGELMRYDQENKVYDREKAKVAKDPLNVFTPFLGCFSPAEIELDKLGNWTFAPKGDALPKDTAIEFKVSFLSRKCSCKIRCSASHTFEDLHKTIQMAFGFDDDHLYGFYMDGKKWSRNVINAPMAGEPPSADKLHLGEFSFYPKQRIFYLFDYDHEWWFNVVVTAVTESETMSYFPEIVHFVGKAPAQYADNSQ